MVKSVKLVWACRVGLCTPNENDENSKNGLGLCLGCGLCIHCENGENSENCLGLCLGCELCVKIGKMVWVRDWAVGCVP